MPSRLVLVFVVDGLRPDAITAADTPTLHRLATEGVRFASGRASVPTVTRVNAATLASGMQPGRHGIAGNQMYVEAADPARAIGTESHRRLLDVDRATGGRLVAVPTLAERLHARGLVFAAVSSGSTGSALLTNPRAPRGAGLLVNGYFDPSERVAWPDAASDAILAKFGPAPPKGRGDARYDAAVTWTERVLREYVLPEWRPAAVINWITEPDHTQHVAGVGSAAAREALRHADREVAGVLASLGALGLAGATDVFVVSDHGFTTNTRGVDVLGELLEAGVAAPGEVVLANSGQAAALHVAGRSRERVARIARFVQSRPWGGALFAAAREPGGVLGQVDGTFSLDAVHLAAGDRAPDLLVTFPWTSDVAASGVAGTDLACVSGGATLFASDHGSFSPWNVRSSLVGWGPSWKRGVTATAPAGNVDVAPTVLALLGIEEREAMDGRVLDEALLGGPDPEQVPVETRVHVAEAGTYRAALQISTVRGRRYVDKGWRVA